jgi:hypothetical protein
MFFAGMPVMFVGVQRMPVRNLRVMSGLLMAAGLVVLRRFAVMLSSLIVMMRRLLVMLVNVVHCNLPVVVVEL